jgi:hypothetical protein
VTPNLAPKFDDFGLLEGCATNATHDEKARKHQKENPQDVFLNIVVAAGAFAPPTPEIQARQKPATFCLPT